MPPLRRSYYGARALDTCTIFTHIETPPTSKISDDHEAHIANVLKIASRSILDFLQEELTSRLALSAELIAYLRARPGKLSYSSAGSGSTTQLPAALFNSMANLDVTHIPYKSGAQALTDTISGEVFMTMTAITTAQPHIKAGMLKAIGVSGMARSHSLPDVPTIAEGGLPGYEFVSWNGLLAPAGTPNEVVARLEAALTRAVASAEFRERLLGAGLEPEPLGARAFADRLLVEIPMWERVVKISGAKAE